MKRIISILLVLVMGLGLFSCVQSNTTGTTTGSLSSTHTTPSSTSNSTTRPTGSSTAGTTSMTNPTGSSSLTTSTTIPSGSGSTTGTTSSSSIINPDDPKEDPDLSGFDKDELALFYELFNPENHITLYLDISSSELKKINDDYKKNNKSPIYRMADLHVTITKPDGSSEKYVVEQVGVRMKGNTSRTEFYSNSNGIYNLVHFKVSFQETFDEVEYYGSDALVWNDSAARKERKNRTFATLEKIDMRWNKNYDATHIREHYAYELYREFDVLAPHTNLASVDIGSVHAGVWLFYEPIDKIFLEKNLPQEALGGDLYKLGWTDQGATFTSFTSYGVEDELAGKFYVYDLKTNKKTSDHSSLKNLIQTINSNSCDRDSFASVVDVENFLMFAAVSYIVGNPDDLRNNYNNCYIYFRADNGKMMIIPYDLDRGLGVNKDWNPSGDHMTTDSPFSDKAIGNGSTQKNPLFTKGILNANFFKNDYVEALKLVGASDMLKVSTFEASFNLAKSLYSGDTATSKNLGNAGNGVSFDLNKSDGSNMSFSNYITKKTQTLSKYISGYTPDVGDGSGSGTVVTEWELYLRGNFNGNNWSNQSQYRFKDLGNGLYSVDVSCNDSLFKFKVYNNNQSGDSAWYNTVDESKTTVWFEYQGGNRNVQVKSGSYTVYFDTKTETLYVVAK